MYKWEVREVIEKRKGAKTAAIQKVTICKKLRIEENILS